LGRCNGAIHEGLKSKELEKPSGIVTATVCKDSGKLATNLCSSDQRGGRVRTELFIEGTAPTSYCDVHVKVSVNRNNNKLATNNTPKSLIESRVFIKKPYASSAAADYSYVVPTIVDDTKEAEKIILSQIGLYTSMDLADAIAILNNNNLKYTFKGDSYSGSLEVGQYTLVSFTKEVVKSGTVELKIKRIASSNSNNSDNNNSDNNNSDNNNSDNNNNDNNNRDNASNDNTDTNNDDSVNTNGDNTTSSEAQE
jgi:penicillin-binding protein 1A